MKITKLRLENINAIKGAWLIDFTDAAFGDGIFAIIGQTGAGKTTILDAICLALYGMTPRLDKITKNHNALMHLSAGSCLAEAEVYIGNTCYQFGFYQRRANQKSDGNLQDPKREIIKIHANGRRELIAESLEQARKMAIEILGMDFTQFTRSVLLAQGSFAAFLQADSSERGAMLEKITGTDIYAKLGMLAYQTHRQKQQELEQLNTRLADIQLPDTNAISELQAQLNQKNIQINDYQAKLYALNTRLQVYAAHQKNLERLFTINKQHQSTKIQLQDFEVQKNRLKLGQKLIALEPDYQQLIGLQRLIEREQQNKCTFEQQLPVLNSQHQQACDEYKNQKITLDKLIIQGENLAATLIEVRALDVRIHALNERQQHTQKEQERIQTALTQSQNDITKSEQQIADHQYAIAIHQDYLNQHSSAKLIDSAHLDELFKKWYDELNNSLTETDLLQKQQQFIQNQRQLIDKLSHEQAAINDKLHAVQKAMAANYEKLDGLLPQSKITADTALDAIDAQIRQITAQQISLQRCLLGADKIDNLLADTASYEQNIATLETQISNHQTQLNNLTQQLSTQQTLIDQTLTHIDTAQAVIDEQLNQALFETYRHHLQDGMPCPLCGSTTHPSTAKANPQTSSDHAYTDIATQKAILETQKQEHNRLQLDISRHAAIIEQQNIQIEQYNQHIQRATKAIAKQLHELQNELSAWVQDENLFFQNSSTRIRSYLEDKLKQLSQNEQQLNEYKLILSNDSKTLAQYQKNSELNTLALNEQYKQKEQAINTWKDRQNTLMASVTKLQATSQKLTIKLNEQNLSHASISDDYSQRKNLMLYACQLIDEWCVICADITKDNLPAVYLQKDKLNNIWHQGDKIDAIWQPLFVLFDDLACQYQDHENALRSEQSALEIEQNSLQNKQAYHQEAQENLKLNTQIYDDNKKQLDILQNQRISLFGQDNPDHSEQNFKHTFSQKQQQLDKLKTHMDDISHQLATTTTQYNQNIKQLDELTSEYQKHKDDFENKLNKLKLNDIQAYLTSRLSGDELEMLSNQYNKLLHTLEHLNQEQENIQNTINQTKAAYHDIDTWQVKLLHEEQLQLQTLLGDEQQQLGAYQERLETLSSRMQLADELLNKINVAKQTMVIWEQLSHLIGSADGKKYRNFVQGLTLDMVLSYANNILSKMSDRYELVQSLDPKQILGIDIKDKYQNNSIRPSKNLSGGESFIVSLALALGLSNINSQKMQIESLFLDEGFGTLDEEALDIALAALSDIQACGKSIGIISHVTTLKERISTQIIVDKKSGGVSVLSGAGVQRL